MDRTGQVMRKVNGFVLIGTLVKQSTKPHGRTREPWFMPMDFFIFSKKKRELLHWLNQIQRVSMWSVRLNCKADQACSGHIRSLRTVNCIYATVRFCLSTTLKHRSGKIVQDIFVAVEPNRSGIELKDNWTILVTFSFSMKDFLCSKMKS